MHRISPHRTYRYRELPLILSMTIYCAHRNMVCAAQCQTAPQLNAPRLSRRPSFLAVIQIPSVNINQYILIESIDPPEICKYENY